MDKPAYFTMSGVLPNVSSEATARDAENPSLIHAWRSTHDEHRRGGPPPPPAGGILFQKELP